MHATTTVLSARPETSHVIPHIIAFFARCIKPLAFMKNLIPGKGRGKKPATSVGMGGGTK